MPQTTIMRDSAVGDAWIQDMCKINPVQRVMDDKGATPFLLTGPVRLAFCDSIFEAKPKMQSDPNSAKTHACTILFTPCSDLAIFWEEYYRICAADFTQFYNAATKQYAVDNPMYDQGDKSKYSGFTAGCMATNVSSQFKPPVVDMRGNPITDPSKVYPGVWAIVSLNAYASGKGGRTGFQPKKGPRFGLATIMLVGDDTPLSGGAPDPRMTFKGVQVKPSAIAPTAAFAQSPAPGAPPATSYYPPSGIAAPPAFAAGSAPPPSHVPAYVPTTLPPPPAGAADEDLSGMI